MRIVLSALLIATLAGCTQQEPAAQKASAAAVAQCVSESSSAAELTQLGATTRVAEPGQPITLRRFDQLSCRGFSGIFATNAELTAQAVAITQKLTPRAEFRQGLQQSIWRRRGMPAEIAASLTDLTMETGRHSVERAWAQGCGLLSEGDSTLLRDLEPVFVTAVIGTHGWAPDVAAAQAMGLDVIEQSKVHALAGAGMARAECTNEVLKAALVEHQQSLMAFVQGKNPMAPGCKAEEQGQEYVLRCTAP